MSTSQIIITIIIGVMIISIAFFVPLLTLFGCLGRLTDCKFHWSHKQCNRTRFSKRREVDVHWVRGRHHQNMGHQVNAHSLYKSHIQHFIFLDFNRGQE
jgi:hypothetical protein